MDQEPSNTDSQSSLLHERIKTALRSSLEEKWDEVLQHWSDAGADERKAVRVYASEFRNRVLRGLLEINTLDELERALAIQYLEVKCHWLMLNTRIQHQTACEGRPEERLIYRAACISLILQALEPLVSQQNLDGLSDLLIESFD